MTNIISTNGHARPGYQPRPRPWVWLVPLLLLGLTGCGLSGLIRYRAADGSQIEVRQPGGAVAPAQLRVGAPIRPQNPNSEQSPRSPAAEALTLEASTGNQTVESQTAGEQTRSLTWAGIALLALGVAGLVARAWFPVLPISACLAAMGLGLALLVLPNLLHNTLFLCLGLGGLGLLILVGWYDNTHKLTGAKS
jgi:hypothetical protein